MNLAVHLLGRPELVRPADGTYLFRSRKSWAVLAYLLLAERPPTRSRLAGLLFAEADDPGRALRWCLSEIRRGLADDGTVDGDPVVLTLAADTSTDVDIVQSGSWRDAINLPGLGTDLLAGMAFAAAPVFDAWLLSEQHRMAAAAEAMLHEAALGTMSIGEIDRAIGFAVRATEMNPLDENHHALLIRLYRLAGDDARAGKQFAALTCILDRELGLRPGPAVAEALRQHRAKPHFAAVHEVANPAAIRALIEAGTAAVAAGAVQPGVQSLRNATGQADSVGVGQLRVAARIALAEALVHSLRGFDEEGLAALYEAESISLEHGLGQSLAQIRAEVGYVDFLRARYDRAEVRLTDALNFPDPSPSERAKLTTYLGCVASDRAEYERAGSLLQTAMALYKSTSDPRREAYALAMLGRVRLFQGDLAAAAALLDESIALAEQHHWLAFLPWPQALRGEVHFARRDVEAATAQFEQAFARACQLGDPCWEGIAARGLALIADAEGHHEQAMAILADAYARANRHADPYVWLNAYILDARCALGCRHGYPNTVGWIHELRELASRTGMREFILRSLLHGAALGSAGDAAALELLAGDLADGTLDRLIR
jgi:DNA-binding SARP family transcriptional activator